MAPHLQEAARTLITMQGIQHYIGSNASLTFNIFEHAPQIYLLKDISEHSYSGHSKVEAKVVSNVDKANSLVFEYSEAF